MARFLFICKNLSFGAISCPLHLAFLLLISVLIYPSMCLQWGRPFVWASARASSGSFFTIEHYAVLCNPVEDEKRAPALAQAREELGELWFRGFSRLRYSCPKPKLSEAVPNTPLVGLSYLVIYLGYIMSGYIYVVQILILRCMMPRSLRLYLMVQHAD